MSKAPGPTAFKFKAAGRLKKVSTGGIFGGEPDEPVAPPPTTSRPAIPRVGLAGGASTGEAIAAPPAVPPGTLAAAQAVADRLAATLAGTGSAAAAPAAATAMPPPPGPEAADPDEGDVADGAVETSRGGYTFAKRYTHAQQVRVVGSAGLQSIDRYENLGLVGRGAFNKIYKARHRETGEVVALKAMQLAALEQSGQVQGDEGVPLEMMREMSIMLSMRHPNIVTVHEIVMDPTQMFMVMELVDFDLGLLIEHMKQPFSEPQVKCLAMQLLSALAAVHECFVLHRDLKQTNLLLDKNGVLKLCDFGLARRYCAGPGKVSTPNVTSLWYRAPEILLGEQSYGTAVDMWSFGCIMAEWLQLGEPLMQGTGDLDQINTIFKLLGTPSEQSWPKFGSLRAVQTAVLPFVENHTISLGPDGTLVKLPKSTLRKKFPAEGYTPAAAQLSEHRTTALSDAGFELLNAFLTCDPEQRATAATALRHPWFKEAPLPVPLSRSEIRQLRRNREEAISSGAHHQALAQQRAAVARQFANEQAAQIAATLKQRIGL